MLILKKLTFIIILCCFTVTQASAEKTVKVFILAGQSNMEGKAKNSLLEYQATQEATKAHYASFLHKDGNWVIRNDVWIKYLKRHGGLTIGYGSPNQTGPELAFGTVLGEHYTEPVLLIKTAWGGHSLYQKFRSPSAGLPTEAKLKEELAKAIARTKRLNEKRKRNDPMPTMKDIKSAYGGSYRMMISEVNSTLKNYETLFPELKGKKLEIAGFTWFQGWNDQYNGAELEYASNMKHFINDVRKDFKAPKLPFVIGVMGQNGATPPKGPMKVIQDAQLSMEQIPEFKGNVKAIRTDVLEDKVAAKAYLTWKDNKEAWEKVGSNGRYHYLGSGIWFNRIGRELAKSMLELKK